MSDPMREPHERDGFLSSTPLPKETKPDLAPEPQALPDGARRPPVLGVVLIFIVFFWGAVAAFFLFR